MTPMRLLSSVLAVATVLSLVPEVEASPRHSWNRNRPAAVPELSVGSAGAALALLGGGVMVMLGRRRRDRS